MKKNIILALVLVLSVYMLGTGNHNVSAEQDVSLNITSVSTENTSKIVVESGKNGGTIWEIFEDGDAVIRPLSNDKGKMSSKVQDTKLKEVTGKIVVEKGVEFPNESKDLFSYFEASSFEFNNDTSNVTNMLNMFSNLVNATELDLSTFDTSNVIIFSGMFNGSKKLKSINLSSFNTEKATNMTNMFSYANRWNHLI